MTLPGSRPSIVSAMRPRRTESKIHFPRARSVRARPGIRRVAAGRPPTEVDPRILGTGRRPHRELDRRDLEREPPHRPAPARARWQAGFGESRPARDPPPRSGRLRGSDPLPRRRHAGGRRTRTGRPRRLPRGGQGLRRGGRANRARGASRRQRSLRAPSRSHRGERRCRRGFDGLASPHLPMLVPRSRAIPPPQVHTKAGRR